MKYYFIICFLVILYSCNSNGRKVNCKEFENLWKEATLISSAGCCANDTIRQMIVHDYKRLLMAGREKNWETVYQGIIESGECNIYIEEDHYLAQSVLYRITLFCSNDTIEYTFDSRGNVEKNAVVERNFYTHSDSLTNCCDFESTEEFQLSGRNSYVFRSNLDLCSDRPKINVVSHSNDVFKYYKATNKFLKSIEHQ